MYFLLQFNYICKMKTIEKPDGGTTQQDPPPRTGGGTTGGGKP